MQFQFQENDRAWDGQFVFIPEGLYEVTITDAGDDVDKNNNMRMKYTAKIDRWVDGPPGAGQEHVGKEVTQYVSFDNDTKRKRAMHFLQAVGLAPKAGAAVNVTREDLVGKRLRVRNTHFIPKQPDGTAGKPMMNFAEEIAIGEAEIRRGA